VIRSLSSFVRVASGSENRITSTVTRADARTGFATVLVLLVSAFAYAPSASAGQFTTTCVCSGSGNFTLTTITPDGTFADWNTVVTNSGIPANGNPRNNVCDEDGSDNGEVAPHPDRDWLVQSTGRDLEQFAFTWDSSNLYFYTRRYASTNNIQRFIYYGDIDGDGKMEGDGNAGTSEIAITIDWQGNNQSVSVYRYYYLQANVGGDDMVDGSGFADGYDLPGSLRNATSLRSGNWGSTDGLQVEFQVTWAELGLSGATPIVFHVSSLNSSINNSTPPNQIDDNAGGCGGGGGSLQFADLDFTPATATLTLTHDTGQPSFPYSEQHCAAHLIENDGNDDDIFNVTVGTLPSFVISTALYADNDASDTLTGGDTLLTDVTEPDAYTNIDDSDSTVDTGVLAPAGTKRILVCYTAQFTNSYTPTAGDYNVTITATSVFDSGIFATVTDTLTVVTVVDLVLAKSSVAVTDPVNGGSNPKRIPGGYVDYRISATNFGGKAVDADTFVLTDVVPAGLDLFVNDRGGSPAGPISMATTTGSFVACGVTTTFVNLGDNTDTVLFSNKVGLLTTDPDADFNDTPVADGNGVDATITGIRIKPTGTFAGQSSANPPSCTWTYRVRVE
jgi:hypothetical protein